MVPQKNILFSARLRTIFAGERKGGPGEVEKAAAMAEAD